MTDRILEMLRQAKSKKHEIVEDQQKRSARILDNLRKGPLVNSKPSVQPSISSTDNKYISGDKPLPLPKFNPKGEKGRVINISDEYDTSAKLVRKKIEKEDSRHYYHLTQVQKDDLVVVSGCMDSIEEILDASRLPYHKTDSDNRLLEKAKVVFVNCPGNNSLKGLRDFVSQGGYLVTTDWALESVIQKNFGHLKHNHKKTSQEVVDVTIPNPNNFYIKGAFPKGIEPSWWLEGVSYPISIRKKDVTILLESPEMGDKYGESAVGVTFPYGKGRVFHFISHFKLQQSKEYRDGDKQSSIDFGKNVLDLTDKEIDELKIDPSKAYGAVESSYSSARIIHNIIVAKKMGYNSNG